MIKPTLTIVVPAHEKHFSTVARSVASIYNHINCQDLFDITIFLILHPTIGIPLPLVTTITQNEHKAKAKVLSVSRQIENSLSILRDMPGLLDSDLVALLAADDFWLANDLYRNCYAILENQDVSAVYLNAFFLRNNTLAPVQSTSLDLLDESAENRVKTFLRSPHDNSMFWGIYRGSTFKQALNTTISPHAPTVAWDWWFFSKIVRSGKALKGVGNLIRDETPAIAYLNSNRQHFGANWLGVFSVADALLCTIADTPNDKKMGYKESLANNMLQMYAMAINSTVFDPFVKNSDPNFVFQTLVLWLVECLSMSAAGMDFLDREKRVEMMYRLNARLCKSTAILPHEIRLP